MKTLTVHIQWAFIMCLAVVLSHLDVRAQNLSGDSEGFVLNGAVRIWYRIEGTGTPNAIPLLMFHGGPGATAYPFEKTIGPKIANERPVVYMDYRGAGRSDRPKDPNQYSFAVLASDAEAIREHLGIEKWSVFGHSNGGATAITYALQYPDRVATIILCDPLLSPTDLKMNMVHKVAFTPADKYEKARAIYRSGQSDEERFMQLLDLMDMKTRYAFQYFNPENGAILNQLQADLAKQIGRDLMEPALIQGLIASGFFQFDAFKSVQNLSMPVLVLLGRYDNEISIDNAMKFALAVQDGYIGLLDRSGHHPYLEETGATAQQINAFLSRHSVNVRTAGAK